MRIYISGKISGLDHDEAFNRFENADHWLTKCGHDPVNPMEGELPSDSKTWAEYMAADIILLDQCDGIYMLENWRDSKGARIEHAIAEICGKAIFYAETDL